MKKHVITNTILGIILLSVTLGFGQNEPRSIHFQQWLEHQTLDKAPSEFDPSGSDIRPLKTETADTLLRKVFGYLPDWLYKGARDDLQYDLLSHIAAFDFVVSPDGSLGNPAYWPWSDVINAAHDHGVKVILTAVNFDADEIRTLLTNATAKSNFFNNAKNKIRTYALDGINIDFEGLHSDDRGSLLNGFMADLTAYMHSEIPGSEVSFAGPSVNWGGWDLSGLAASCDYIFIMGYSFYGSWSSTSGPCAPLTGGSYNITNTIETQYADVTANHPEKLILGVPYYGNRWQTKSSSARSEAVSYIGSVSYNAAVQEADYNGANWDAQSQTPWFSYKDGSQWYQVWYDNVESLSRKYDLADSKNLLGVGMWALGYDAARVELWNELRQRYLPGTQPMPDKPAGVAVTPVSGQNSVHIVMRAATFTDGFMAYWGTDGQTYSDSVYLDGNSGTITDLQDSLLYFFKLRAKNERGLSDYSAVLASSVGDSLPVLIVDGFDRNDKGYNQFNYAVRHAKALQASGFAVATAQNEAVTDGRVNLHDFKAVDWYLGNESTADITFSNAEKNSVRDYLETGGWFFVSGAEIGWDLVAKGSDDDKSFYENYLKAKYLADAPNGRSSEYYRVDALNGTIFDGLASFSFDDGTHGTYNIAWPDAIASVGGSTLALGFSGVPTSSGGAAVSYAGKFGNGSKTGKLVYLSFPFESINTESSRTAVMSKVMDSFLDPSAITNNGPLPSAFHLEQNYPNPFNPATVIRYRLSAPVDVRLIVYNILGQKIRTLVDEKQEAGTHTVRFDASALAAGVYIYKLTAANGFSQVKKMTVIR